MHERPNIEGFLSVPGNMGWLRCGLRNHHRFYAYRDHSVVHSVPPKGVLTVLGTYEDEHGDTVAFFIYHGLLLEECLYRLVRHVRPISRAPDRGRARPPRGVGFARRDHGE